MRDSWSKLRLVTRGNTPVGLEALAALSPSAQASNVQHRWQEVQMRDKHESGKGDHGDSHLRGGQGEAKKKKDESSGGNMGAGQSGNEGLGPEKPTDNLGSNKASGNNKS